MFKTWDLSLWVPNYMGGINPGTPKKNPNCLHCGKPKKVDSKGNVSELKYCSNQCRVAGSKAKN